MVRRYTFFPVVFTLVAGLACWSNLQKSGKIFHAFHSGELNEPTVSTNDLVTKKRQELLEVLDRIITYEHYYTEIYGHYTKLLPRIGVAVPVAIADQYDIRIVEASSNHLLLTAYSEINGKTVDVVSVDQGWNVRANFDLPNPREEHLQAQARKHLRYLSKWLAKSYSSRSALASSAVAMGALPEEQALYRGYFEYQILDKGKKSILAEGVKAPVTGVKIEFDGDFEVTSAPEISDFDVVFGAPASHLEEEAALAQIIFEGEMGRYATSWTELAKIGHFRFDGLDQEGHERDLLTSEVAIKKLLKNSTSSDESDLSRKIASDLVIEPIGSNESSDLNRLQEHPGN